MLRLDNLRNKMKDLNIDGVIINSPENRRYLSGFTGSSAYLLISKSEAHLITDFRYIEQAKKQTTFKVVDQGLSILGTINSICSDLSIKNLGFEDAFLNVAQYREMSEKLDIELIPIGDVIETLRSIKDESEINNIKKAVALGDKTFLHIVDFIKPGISEREIALEMEYYIKKNGAEDLAFETIVASGIHSSMPHAHPTDKLIENGDFVTLDFGCKIEGYCSDMTRTIVVGKASDQQKEIYNVVLEAQLKALDFICTGKKGNEVDKIARDYIAEMGYGQNFGHSLGHGVGLYIHEKPNLSSSYDKELKTGAVVTVEPGIYIEGFGGVRIEDMVIIKDNGIDNLMTSPKHLIEI